MNNGSILWIIPNGSASAIRFDQAIGNDWTWLDRCRPTEEWTDDMSDYENGVHDAFLTILRAILPHLPKGEEATKAELLAERQETIRALRNVCAYFGDNSWPDNLYIPDIIDKYLYTPLADRQEDHAQDPG
jgi:hypothetical protein